MKVLTLNTHAWMEEDPYDKIEKIVDRIAAKVYRFVALQEINQSLDAEVAVDPGFIKAGGDDPGVAVKADNFALLIVEGLRERGLDYYWSWTANHIGYDKYDEGVAILSRLPFEAESLLVSDCQDYTHHYTRRILKASVEEAPNKWTVLSCHYSWWKDGKGRALFRKEWDKTRHLLEGDKETSLLVMGDFNNEAAIKGEGYDYVTVTAPFLSDSYAQAMEINGDATVISAIDGWNDHPDEKRIDYIFTDNRKRIDRYRVVFDGQNGQVVSDHFGIEAEISETN
ncbi:maltose 6'-phosphate phosphatase [Alkalibacterium subtropicum]|uniref:Maltose 6'-phosphate phosphatase n=1 Tax=Alkalibacterium subtropicum TaxID=753702 RepID=A0A1I1KJB8_9LACT|nr:endonuclease/exonuclease/phosphatase family protein [Alkalibacterium subtropicum]SFC60655.1 maltose 6'-phosphate phosphatase [Alkalibacterium subtropicum]